MRPVLLELDGFTSFREPATVDFTDVDFFALVGPTGAGKSTIIDAITFALYGAVPRWDSRSKISLGLAPTTARGTVRLVFDAGAHRYVVARELRRTTQGVSQKTIRLERLSDPTGTGAAGEDTTVLGADSEVTRKVEQLLGLTFEHFCRCVVLPQNRFAEFLQAKPSERQEILLALLGAQRYEGLAQAANQRAKLAEQRIDLLATQLLTYQDATPDALAQAQDRETDLATLATTAAKLLPALAGAEQDLSVATADLARIQDHQAALAQVQAPPTVATLHQELESARTAHQSAVEAEQVATDADTAARAALAAAPPREPLQAARRLHAEHAILRTDEPGLSAAADQAETEQQDAAKAADQAADALETARVEAERAHTAQDQAQERVEDLSATIDALTAVTAPTALADLAGRHTAAQAAVAAAENALSEAETTEAAAAEALAAAPDPAPLRGALEDLTQIATLESAAAPVDRDLQTAREQLLATTQALTGAQEQANDAERVRHADLVAHQALALREHLSLGEPCPVCEHEVQALPTAASAPAELSTTQDALTAARTKVSAAEADLREATARVATLEARHHTLTEQLTETRTRLQGRAVTGDKQDIDAQLAGREHLEATARTAATAVRTARAGLSEATTASRSVTADVHAARTALNVARDPLVALGAPQPATDDVEAAWAQLLTWCTHAAAAHRKELTAAKSGAKSTDGAAKTADATHRAAKTTLAAATTRLTAAIGARERTAAAARAATVRIAELTVALADQPSDADAAKQLSTIADLEHAAVTADVALGTARTATRTARAAVTALQEREEDAWRQLRAARDELVPHGVPELPAGTLTDAWAFLTGWVTHHAIAVQAALKDATKQITTHTGRRDQLTGQLTALLGQYDVPVPGGSLTTSVPVALATATSQAQAATARIQERQREAADLLGARAVAASEQQVAQMLGRELRSDHFPRWLVGAALDTLVIEASQSLSQLSGGQFELTHRAGEFYVVDHADADAQRSVRTLSGGETFQASLALALALSSQMSGLAGPGAAQLDSIFLDEGFGTLDEATLEIVAATLENLASGDRMVGIVTHVAALADRIPVRFVVHRDQRSSRVVREGAI